MDYIYKVSLTRADEENEEERIRMRRNMGKETVAANGERGDINRLEDDTSKVSSKRADEENEAERIRRLRIMGKERVAEDGERGGDIDKLAEDFIKKFRNELKIQQLEFTKHRAETSSRQT